MEKDVVIFDIETNVLNKKPDGEVDKLKYCGFKLPSGVYLVYSEKQISAIQQIFNRFNVFSGHNILGYDLPVLRRYGIRFKDCTFIDTYQIASKRMETMMGYKGLGLGMKSLRFLAELFNLPSKKGEFDYELLKKPFLNSEEYELMKEYLIGDLDTSEALLEYFMDFFSGFKEFMSYKDVSTYKWLTSSSGTTAYKCICNQAGIPEIYDDNPTKSKFQAAISWVNPKLKYAENVVCLDFASLYPHMMIGGNLYSTTVDNDGAWHGGSDVYKSIEVDKKNGIRGYYKKEQGKIEKVLFDSYLERKNIKKYMKSLDRNSEEYRNLDRKQYAIKIYLNTCFDKQTEILTRDGIKFVKDVKVGENVLSINKETHELEWKKVTNVYKFKYEGDMVGYRNKNTDILVTPDHDMVFEGKNGITQTLKAKQLSKRARYNQLHIKPVENRKSETKDISEYLGKPKNIFVKLNNPYSQRKNKNIKYIHSLVMHKVLDGNMNYDGEYFYQYNKRGIKYKRFVDVNAFMYLVGIYIAEGCCRIIQPKEYKTAKRGKSYISNISQYKDINPNTYNKIENILKQLGFRYYKTNKSFCISDKGLYDFFITCGKGSGNKKIPFNLDDLSYENLYSLHEGLYDGDGNKAQYRYTTKSKKLRDQMVELNLLLGFRCNYTYDGCWRIARTTQGTFKRENFYTKHYNDYVYCVTVEDNHTVYVGRNGKFSFTGQCYGIAGNPRFKQVFNLNRANDITAMARASITHARDKFKSYGYEVLYIHTDSCYVIDKFKNIEKIKEIAKEITEEQKKSFNIPIDTHEFEFEEFYKKMWLVQGDDGKNIKNRNIRLTEDNKIKFTGIKMQSLAVSDLAKKVFWDYIVPQLVGDKKDLFFKPEELKKQLKEVAKKQPELLEVRRKVYDCSTYKSDTSMQYQISKRYGEGVHKLIANGYIGAGKSKKYCKMSELKKTFKNKWLDAVDYSAYLRDLSEFINPVLRKKLK